MPPARCGVPSTQPGTVLVLEAERACYLSGVKGEMPHDPDRLRANARSVRAVQYSELSELLWSRPAEQRRDPAHGDEGLAEITGSPLSCLGA